jgi:hypothetical protein
MKHHIIENFYRRISAVTLENLYSKYEGVLDPETINLIVSSDPTYQGGSTIGSYTPWLLQKVSNGSIPIDELGAASEGLALFTRLKPKLQVKDIYQYQNLEDLYSAINPFIETNALSQTQKKQEGATIHYNDGQWLLIEPLTPDAAKLYGAGSKWCTTSKQEGERIFNNLLKNSSIYIIIDRASGEKFQFDVGTESFMNSLDKYGYQDFINLNPPSPLLEWVRDNFALPSAIKQEEKREQFKKIREEFPQIEAKIVQDYQSVFGNRRPEQVYIKLIQELAQKVKLHIDKFNLSEHQLTFMMDTEIDIPSESGRNISILLGDFVEHLITTSYQDLFRKLCLAAIQKDYQRYLNLDPLASDSLRDYYQRTLFEMVQEGDDPVLLKGRVTHDLLRKIAKELHTKELLEFLQENNANSKSDVIMNFIKEILPGMPENFTKSQLSSYISQNTVLLDKMKKMDKYLTTTGFINAEHPESWDVIRNISLRIY